MDNPKFNQLISDISDFIVGHGLDPILIKEPTAIRSGDANLVTETYPWGEYHRGRMKEESVNWVGDSACPSIPEWAAKLLKAAGEDKVNVEKQKAGPTERARRRLEKRNRTVRKVSDSTQSVDLSIKCMALIASRSNCRLAANQAAAADGDMFIRNHYRSSKYLSLFIRRGEEVIKLAQFWPLARSKAFHIQVLLEATTQKWMRGAIPPQYEVTTWKDIAPRAVIKSVDDIGISYVARAIAKSLEENDAL